MSQHFSYLFIDGMIGFERFEDLVQLSARERISESIYFFSRVMQSIRVVWIFPKCLLNNFCKIIKELALVSPCWEIFSFQRIALWKILSFPHHACPFVYGGTGETLLFSAIEDLFASVKKKDCLL